MNYYLCSQEVITHLQPSEVSKPFKSGYAHDDDSYYVALLDEDETEKYYNEVIEPYNEKSRVHCDFWTRPCEPGTMDSSSITLEDCKEFGLFKAIEIALSLSTEKNRALVIGNLAHDFNCTPIEFIDLIAGIDYTTTTN